MIEGPLLARREPVPRSAIAVRGSIWNWQSVETVPGRFFDQRPGPSSWVAGTVRTGALILRARP